MFIFILGLFVGLVLGFFGLKFLHRKQIDQQIADTHNRIMAISLGHKDWFSLNPLFSETIQNLSPSFCEIYEQAKMAEKAKLDAICGISYGKSLEFLIKDFAKIENPQKLNEIENCPLGTVVKQYIKDDSIKNSSELAVWLRNDETHYIKKHNDKDVNHLKALIDLIIGLIENAEKRKLLAENVNKIKSTFTS